MFIIRAWTLSPVSSGGSVVLPSSAPGGDNRANSKNSADPISIVLLVDTEARRAGCAGAEAEDGACLLAVDGVANWAIVDLTFFFCEPSLLLSVFSSLLLSLLAKKMGLALAVGMLLPLGTGFGSCDAFGAITSEKILRATIKLTHQVF